MISWHNWLVVANSITEPHADSASHSAICRAPGGAVESDASDCAKPRETATSPSREVEAHHADSATNSP